MDFSSNVQSRVAPLNRDLVRSAGDSSNKNRPRSMPHFGRVGSRVRHHIHRMSVQEVPAVLDLLPVQLDAKLRTARGPLELVCNDHRVTDIVDDALPSASPS